jgi:hypothetical protein
MITLLSDQTFLKVGEKICGYLEKNNVELAFFPSMEMNVKPCFACGGCTNSTYGKCVHRDDGDIILPKLMQSEILLIVTKVKWGSYSFKTKRILDKCAVIGDRHYYLKNRELVKGGIGRIKRFIVVGVKDQWSPEEKDVFLDLVEENIRIMNVEGRAFLLENDLNSEVLKEIMGEVQK